VYKRSHKNGAGVNLKLKLPDKPTV